jgi:DNA-binding NarL/FixJ family response regulator
MNEISVMASYPLPAKLRILLVDDHALIVESMVSALSLYPDFVVSFASDAVAALGQIECFGVFDLILLDYDMPGEDPFTGLKKMIEVNHGAVALFSGVAKRWVIDQAMDCGAIGFVPKTLPLKALQHAIRLMADGEIFMPSEYMRRDPQVQDQAKNFKQIELKVIGFLVKGHANKEIGREVGIDETTVKMHIRAIFRKMGVTNRTQVVHVAQKLGIC